MAPKTFLRTVSIMLIPSLCLRKSVYGIPVHTPVSLLKTILLPCGAGTTQSPFLWVETMYPASSSMEMENRLAIPLSFFLSFGPASVTIYRVHYWVVLFHPRTAAIRSLDSVLIVLLKYVVNCLNNPPVWPFIPRGRHSLRST